MSMTTVHEYMHQRQAEEAEMVRLLTICAKCSVNRVGRYATNDSVQWRSVWKTSCLSVSCPLTLVWSAAVLQESRQVICLVQASGPSSFASWTPSCPFVFPSSVGDQSSWSFCNIPADILSSVIIRILSCINLMCSAINASTFFRSLCCQKFSHIRMISRC